MTNPMPRKNHSCQRSPLLSWRNCFLLWRDLFQRLGFAFCFFPTARATREKVWHRIVLSSAHCDPIRGASSPRVGQGRRRPKALHGSSFFFSSVLLLIVCLAKASLWRALESEHHARGKLCLRFAWVTGGHHQMAAEIGDTEHVV